MKTATRIELVFIVIATAATFGAAWGGWLPDSVRVGTLCLTAAAVLLGQGLIRDLIHLRRMKKEQGDSDERVMMCMCLESTVGMVGVIAGTVVLGVGFSLHVGVSVKIGRAHV